MQNPQQGMEQMFGNNPIFQQARKMAEGKSPEQMKETVLNLANIYVKLSKAWFEDPDVSEGKAYRYYMQVAKA